MSPTLPNNVKILHLLSQHLETHLSLLDSKSDDYKNFKSLCLSHTYLDDSPTYLNTPHFVTHVQMMMLAGISMLGGFNIPVIRDFQQKDSLIKIQWDGGTTDTFTLGVHDKAFIKFYRYFQTRALQHSNTESKVSPHIFGAIKQLTDSYGMILDAVGAKCDAILADKHAIVRVLKTHHNKDLLFILLSCLPSEQLNTLYIHIQQFFPSDLEITLPSGNKVNACSLFGTSTTDIAFLIEKTRVYMDLYFSNKLPIIQSITQSKTFDFLDEMTKNTSVFIDTFKQLSLLKENQVNVRVKLYELLSFHLSSFADV
jgi:hypothetical protein